MVLRGLEHLLTALPIPNHLWVYQSAGSRSGDTTLDLFIGRIDLICVRYRKEISSCV